MTERTITEAAARLRLQREPHLVATVMSTHGSAYRRPGARMLLTQFRWIAGSVSGGCLEGDIANKGWWRTRDGEPVIVTYDSRLPDNADDDDVRAAFGLGCDGVVEVMIERAGVAGRLDPLAFAEACAGIQRRGAVATVFRSTDPEIRIGTRLAVRAGDGSIGTGSGLIAGPAVICDPIDGAIRDELLADVRAALELGQSCNRSYHTARGKLEAFIEVMLPPPRLFVFGTGHDAVPVARLARSLGWEVAICATQSRVATHQRFAGDKVIIGTPRELAANIAGCDRAAAVVMAHSYELDRDYVGALTKTRVHYIGVLGPRARTSRMLDELAVAAPDDPRIHAPVGLELGAETPEEIALAIVSEIQAVLRCVPAKNLRDRVGPIHHRTEPSLAIAL